MQLIYYSGDDEVVHRFRKEIILMVVKHWSVFGCLGRHWNGIETVFFK